MPQEVRICDNESVPNVEDRLHLILQHITGLSKRERIILGEQHALHQLRQLGLANRRWRNRSKAVAGNLVSHEHLRSGRRA